MHTLITHIDTVPPMHAHGGEVRILISPGRVQSQHLIMGTATVPVGGTVPRHMHPHSEEAFFVLQGEGEIDIAGSETIAFKAGDAVLTPRGAGHTIRNTGSEMLQVVFATSPLAPSPSEGHRLL